MIRRQPPYLEPAEEREPWWETYVCEGLVRNVQQNREFVTCSKIAKGFRDAR
jgi:hypothetical protein